MRERKQFVSKKQKQRIAFERARYFQQLESKELQKAIIKVIDGKVRTEQALCECGKWMQEVEKDFKGFPSIIRTEPTLNKK